VASNNRPVRLISIHDVPAKRERRSDPTASRLFPWPASDKPNPDYQGRPRSIGPKRNRTARTGYRRIRFAA
jgi:hypothetical protein